MKAGQTIQVKREDSDWLIGTVVMASGNGRSVALTVDEGLPVPFGLLGCKQTLCILQAEDGSWSDILSGKGVAVNVITEFEMQILCQKCKGVSIVEIAWDAREVRCPICDSLKTVPHGTNVYPFPRLLQLPDKDA